MQLFMQAPSTLRLPVNRDRDHRLPSGPATIVISVHSGPGNMFPLDLPDVLVPTAISPQMFARGIQWINNALRIHYCNWFLFGLSVLIGLLALSFFVLMRLYPDLNVANACLVAAIALSVASLGFFAMAVLIWNWNMSDRLETTLEMVESFGQSMNTQCEPTLEPIQQAYLAPDAWVEVHRARQSSAGAPTMACRLRWTIAPSCCYIRRLLVEAIDIYWDPTAPPLRTPDSQDHADIDLQSLIPLAIPIPIAVPVPTHAIGVL